jgi:hypothetical protein
MLRIVYNGTELDVDQKADMFLSFQANDLTELGTRGDVFNNTWELPISANNRRAFKLIEGIKGNRQASLTFKPCQVYVDSTLLVAGLGRVAEVRMNKYYFEVVGALRGFGQIVEALTGSDVSLGVYNGSAIGTGVIGSLVAYPIIANGITDNFTLVDNDVPAVVFPWGNLRLLAHKICEVAGYEVADTAADALQEATYIGGRTSYNSQAWADGAAQWAVDAQGFSSLSAGTWEAVFATRLQSSIYAGGSNEAVFTCPNDHTFLNIKIDIEVGKFTNGGLFTGLLAQFSIQSSFYGDRFVYDLRDASSGGFGDRISIDIDLYCNPNEQFIFSIRMPDYPLTTNTLVTKKGSTITITPKDYIAPGSTVTLRNIYGGDVKDILLEYCNRFGKLISVNEDAKKVTFSDINNLQNGAVALDWTNKIVSPEDLQIVGPYQSEFTYGTLATENTFNNANGIGSSAILSDILTTEPTKVMFESKLLGSIDNYKQVMANLLGQIIEGFVPKTSTNWRVWKIGTTYSTGDYVIEKDSKGWFKARQTTTGNDPLASDSAYWRPIPFSELYDSFGIEDTYIAKFTAVTVPNVSPWDSEISPAPGILYKFFVLGSQFAYFQTSFAPVTWSVLLPTYQKPVVDALLQPRVDKFEIDLTIADVTDLDFSRAIIIDGQGYYLNLVDQFDPVNNLPTPCELVQLAQS